MGEERVRGTLCSLPSGQFPSVFPAIQHRGWLTPSYLQRGLWGLLKGGGEAPPGFDSCLYLLCLWFSCRRLWPARCVRTAKGGQAEGQQPAHSSGEASGLGLCSRLTWKVPEGEGGLSIFLWVAWLKGRLSGMQCGFKAASHTLGQ